jgi:predicted RNA-binding Zn-ribbon protein involved in translation (DUF1610 family)
MTDDVLSKEQAKQVYGKDYVDVTDQVEHYEHGKTFACDCGQDFGVVYEESHWKCPTCSRMVVDRKSKLRGWEDGINGANQNKPTKVTAVDDEGDGRSQSGLDAFM